MHALFKIIFIDAFFENNI